MAIDDYLDTDNLHVRERIPCPSEKFRNQLKKDLEARGIKTIEANSHALYDDTDIKWLVVAKTPRETDDRLMNEYFDEEPYHPRVINGPEGDEDE